MSYLDEYKVTVPEGKSGDWCVQKFVVDKDDEAMGKLRAAISFSSAGRWIPEGVYTQLKCRDTIVMSDTPDEIRDHLEPIRRATGYCLVNGLGLGVVVGTMLKKPEVIEVWVVEKSQDVINLVGPHYRQHFGDRLRIFQADALTFNASKIKCMPERKIEFDVVWHDIWNSICTDNIAEMTILHRKYGHRCKWQGSWSRELCLLHRRREAKNNDDV